jgi:hypothetical protein
METWHEHETAVRDAIAEGVPGFGDLPEASRRNIVRAFGRYWRLPSTLAEFGDSAPGETYATLAERFTAYLATPFDTLGFDSSAFGAPARAQLIDALLHAIDIARWTTHPDMED